MAAALVLYGAAVLLVGIFSARDASRSADAFLVGDRGFSAFTTWAALSSTVIGGSTTLVLAALVAAVGLPALWLDLAGALGLLALGLFLAPSVRATGATTIAEVIGRTYGPSVRKIAALLVVLAEIVWFALLTEATETVVVATTPWEPTRVLVITAALFVTYTALGGQRAVVRTDLLQFGLMAAGLLAVAFPLAVSTLARTPVPAELLHFPTGPRFSWADAFALLVLVGLPHAVGSDVWAKLLSARDERAARRAALFAALSKLAFGLATAAIALAGVARGIGGPKEELFPRAVFLLAGSALAPLLLVALVATMQSSADSVLLSAAAATSHDLLGEKAGVGASRLAVVAYGGLGLAVALVLRDLVETFRLGYTLFASGLILPTLVAFLPGVRADRRFAGAAMLLGGAAALLERFAHPFGVDPVLAGTGVNALVLALGLRRRGPYISAPSSSPSIANAGRFRASDGAEMGTKETAMTKKHLSLALVALALAPAASSAFAAPCRVTSALDVTERGAAIGSRGTTEVRAEGERQRLRVAMDARVPDGTVFGVFVNGSLAGTFAVELGAGEVDLSHGDEGCSRSGMREVRGIQRIEVMDRAGNQVLRGLFRTPASCSVPDARD